MLSAACLLHSQAPRSDAAAMERTFQAAMAAQDRGDLRTAESLLLSLRKAHPANFAVDESLGLLYAAQQRYDAALPLLQSASHEAPTSDVAQTNLGAAYFHLQRNGDALDAFQRAVRLNPKNLTAQQSLGQVLLELHKPDRAAEAYAAALALDPANADLMQARAQALAEAGQPDAARAQLTAMPGLDESAAAQSLLGDIEEKRGDFLAAAHSYQLAAQLDPSEANVWALGVELLRHWTFDAAVREFEAATKQYPQSTRMHQGLGAAYFGNGSYAQAVPVFADLLETDPANAFYAEMLGMACSAVTQQPRPRCTALLAYAQAHPADAKAAVYAAAGILQGQPADDQTRQARALLEGAIAANPRLPEAHYQLGLLLQNQTDWSGSISHLEAAIALQPTLAQAHYRLALAYWRSGRKQEGQEQMELQKKYATQEKEDLDQRLRQITIFLVDGHK
jgi:tetratricopeptide (TPR) repeat protein